MSNLWPKHDTAVNLSKVNWIKLWNSIIKQPNFEGRKKTHVDKLLKFDSESNRVITL